MHGTVPPGAPTVNPPGRRRARRQEAAIRSAQQPPALGEAPIRIAATFGLGQAHHALGHYAVARRHLRDVIAAVDAARVKGRRVRR
jgi:hypothetical protein